MNHMTTVFQNPRALMVRNLRPGLTECGKIKIGAKGQLRKSSGGKEFQPPQKLDHFVITTLQRGADGNFLRDDELHEKFGDKPTEIPVRLLFDDPWLNFQTVYTAFRGATRFCTGDGETAERLQQDGKLKQISCPCHLLDPAYQGQDKCKINGTLSVMIEGATVLGGVWKLRTTSINTCQGIASSLAFILSVTGGKLAGIPLMLTVRPKAATTPTGVSTTVYVVGIEFRGTIEQLRDYAHEQALSDAKHGERMKLVEDHARKMLTAPVINDAEDEDLRDEFYPRAAAQAHGAHLPDDDERRTAAERRAAMAAVDSVESVEIVTEDGEVHYVAPGAAAQFLRDNPGAARADDAPEAPTEPRQAPTPPSGPDAAPASPSPAKAPAAAQRNGNGGGKYVVWMSEQAQMPYDKGGDAIDALESAVSLAFNAAHLDGLLKHNKWYLKAPAEMREKIDQAAQTRLAELETSGDPDDSDKIDDFPPHGEQQSDMLSGGGR